MRKADTKAHQVHKGIINGQGIQAFSQDKLGLSTFARAGCCPIATYNVMQMLGKEITLGQVADQYMGGPCGCIFFGIFGCGPWNTARFLRRHLGRGKYHGFLKVKKLEESTKDGDIIIFYMMNHRYRLSQGFHCIAGRRRSGQFELYNVYNNSPHPWRFPTLSQKAKEGHFVYGFLIRPEEV